MARYDIRDVYGRQLGYLESQAQGSAFGGALVVIAILAVVGILVPLAWGICILIVVASCFQNGFVAGLFQLGFYILLSVVVVGGLYGIHLAADNFLVVFHQHWHAFWRDVPTWVQTTIGVILLPFILAFWGFVLYFVHEAFKD